MGQNIIKELCACNNQKEAARILYEENGWDGANEGATLEQLQIDYDLSLTDAEEVFGYIIDLEEQDGIERDEFGNIIDQDEEDF